MLAMGAATKVLFFAEDPGAANFIAPLPASLAGRGIGSAVIAAGAAIGILRQRGIHHSVLGNGVSDASILTRTKPRVLIAGTASNPGTRGLTLITAARRAGVPTIGVVDAAMNAGMRFRGYGNEPMAHAPDWVLVPDEWTRSEYLRLGLASDRVITAGNPHYDFVRAFAETWDRATRRAFRRRFFAKAPPRARVWVFVSEGADRRSELVLEKVLAALDSVKQERRPYFVLRIHPRDRTKDYAAYRRKVDMISQTEPTLELVYAADVVVGLTSMLLTEAQILGRQVLPFVPRAEERPWLPGVRLGILNAAASSSQIRQRIHSVVARLDSGRRRPGRLAALEFGATGRVASFVENVLGSVPARTAIS